MKMQWQDTSPLFSVIIPVYNRERYIARAVESVLQQSFKDYELIIVDDGSTDNTPNVIKKYPATIIHQPNLGVSVARNRGIQAAQGKFIALLDSDDEWKKNHLAHHAQFFTNYPDYKIHQTDEIWIRNGKFLNKKKIHLKKGGRIFYDSLHLCLISPSAVAIKRELFNEIGFFREDFAVCEDYELWLRITKRYPVGYTPIATVIKYGGHSDQLSRKYYAMDRWRIKAMLPFCIDPKVVEIALKKCQILLQGAMKHQNREILEEFMPIYEQLLQKHKVFAG
ncbi:glycosyltransferase [Nitratiruptor sp. YY09-18]|uniref:glycosyltransferase family 2 protein n=1 Tax=Nitratiruptor sp. YY09-18 TaxID=2724901 RepID=UPI0019387420|nr:glycosyltransferase [Nitratiruptor sp. YY09-18]BCD68332.1 glycosyl transferase, family 2 [Nitratiruptor sp. YY09-18]